MPRRIMNSITEETLLPIGLVVSFLGFVFWFSGFHSEAKASIILGKQNSEEITEINKDRAAAREKLYNALNKIDSRLSYKEGAMNLKVRKGITDE